MNESNSPADEPLDIDFSIIEALMARIQQAIEYELALEREDYQILLQALSTLVHLQQQLADRATTVHKMRKLLGMVRSSEKLSHLAQGLPDWNEPPTEAPQTQPRPPRPAGKRKTAKRTKPEVIHHQLSELGKGTCCPGCQAGKLYAYEPARLLRISGQTPFSTKLHLSERVRCNGCGAFFTADLPAEVKADGEANQQYGYSARSLMALNKYFAGAPFYRQESMQSLLNYPISASTVFDQCEHLANHLQPLWQAMGALAGDACHFHLDDTTHRILDQKPIEKKRRNSNKTRLRRGVYASGIIATLEQGQELVLFQTSIGHAGEFIDELLEKRTSGQPPPLLMSDALPSNTPTAVPVERSLCNAHARRQFVDLYPQYPTEIGHVLELYKNIWRHDTEARDDGLSPAQRLAYHQAHSLPIMEQLHEWCQNSLSRDAVEENSNLGRAIQYFLRHYEGLTCFCRIEGARLDNNLMETLLKWIVRGRKNAYFYKTPAGAAISDVITSVIATAMRSGINVFDYLNALQRHHSLVKENPMDWMPWVFAEKNPASNL